MTSFSRQKCSNSKNKNIRFVRMTCSMFMGNFVETGRKLKKLKHVCALVCIFVRRVKLIKNDVLTSQSRRYLGSSITIHILNLEAFNFRYNIYAIYRPSARGIWRNITLSDDISIGVKPLGKYLSLRVVFRRITSCRSRSTK